MLRNRRKPSFLCSWCSPAPNRSCSTPDRSPLVWGFLPWKRGLTIVSPPHTPPNHHHPPRATTLRRSRTPKPTNSFNMRECISIHIGQVRRSSVPEFPRSPLHSFHSPFKFRVCCSASVCVRACLICDQSRPAGGGGVGAGLGATFRDNVDYISLLSLTHNASATLALNVDACWKRGVLVYFVFAQTEKSKRPVADSARPQHTPMSTPFNNDTNSSHQSFHPPS